MAPLRGLASKPEAVMRLPAAGVNGLSATFTWQKNGVNRGRRSD